MNPDRPCGGIREQEISFCAVNIVLDLAIVIPPMPALLSWHIKMSKKIGLVGLLSLGFSICIINITRLGLIVTTGNEDFTYSTLDVGLLTEMEVWIGDITASLPTLGPIFRQNQTASQGRALKYYRSRSGSASSWPSNKTFGTSILATNASSEPPNDEAIALKDRAPLQDRIDNS
ncbi:hypothetical protein BU26DRAFT_611751 [Trematosphaeria pertusa]|uniref:Rhodopsin domain-containing protein n=1 Tax=Trematosphaeria pertusa TaxID=390896 RepID=A0A6A6HR65_9PLEO|nr:uncharacterized protein BU26DRAFT_611751 [Trematosphaeria pertusa]KAF2240322.1 hypothetical protein BU26DRAFT_611751 [Trematosphaeria pertusa]